MREQIDLKVYIGQAELGYAVKVKDEVWNKTTFIALTKWGARRQVRRWARQRGITNPITFIYY